MIPGQGGPVVIDGGIPVEAVQVHTDRQDRADRLARQVHEAMEAGFDAGYRTALDIIEGYVDRSTREHGEAGDIQRFVAYLKRAIAAARERVKMPASAQPSSAAADEGGLRRAAVNKAAEPLVRLGQGDFTQDFGPGDTAP